MEEQHGGGDDWVFRLIKDHIDMGDKIERLSARIETIERHLNILSIAARAALGTKDGQS